MADKIALEIVTPERRVLALGVDEVVMPTVEGYMGVLPGHAPLLALLDVGELSYRVGKERHYLTVANGYTEVLRDSVSIMAETSEKAEEIDLERAERARERAEKELAVQSSQQAFAHAEVRLKKALTRIQTYRRLSG